MIKACIVKDFSGDYLGFQISGHADYSSYGRDVICAAVSALAVNTVNSIECLTDDSIKSAGGENSSGLIKCRFMKSCSLEAKLLMDSLVLGLTEIRNIYGDTYIKILFKEV